MTNCNTYLCLGVPQTEVKEEESRRYENVSRSFSSNMFESTIIFHHLEWQYVWSVFRNVQNESQESFSERSGPGGFSGLALQKERRERLSGDEMEEVLVCVEENLSVLVHESDGESCECWCLCLLLYIYMNYWHYVVIFIMFVRNIWVKILEISRGHCSFSWQLTRTEKRS